MTRNMSGRLCHTQNVLDSRSRRIMVRTLLELSKKTLTEHMVCMTESTKYMLSWWVVEVMTTRTPYNRRTYPNTRRQRRLDRTHMQ